MSRDLAQAHPEVARKVRHLIEEFNLAHAPKHFLIVTSTYRTAEEQRALFEQGRTQPGPRVTDCDGFRRESKHQRKNPATGIAESDAVDLAVLEDPDGEGPVKPFCDWSHRALFADMGQRAERLGLVWGGRFRKIDAPHVERQVGE